MKKGADAAGEIIDRVSSYISNSGEAELPEEVIHKLHSIGSNFGAAAAAASVKLTYHCNLSCLA